MSNFKNLVSKELFNDAPIITVDHSLKRVNDTLFMYVEREQKGSNYFFGLNIPRLRRSEFAVLVLGNDLACLKIPTEFLLKLPLYKYGNRYVVNIQFDEDTHEYVLTHRQHNNKTFTNCTQFLHSLASNKQIMATAIGLRHILDQE